jgi:pyruvate kinase
MRHTKIIATVGPACDTAAKLDALIAAGVDIFRLNFSHGTHDSQSATFDRIRAAARRSGREVAILQDLGGPKIRTGRLEGGRSLQLTYGATLRIATGDFVGGTGRISTTFEGLARSVTPGNRLLLADGLIERRVESTNGTEIVATVIEGGELGERKGINAPGVPLPASAITLKDADDLTFGLSLGVDLVALSFVQSAADLQQARRLMTEQGQVPLSPSSNGRQPWSTSTRFLRLVTESWWPAAILASRCRSSVPRARRTSRTVHAARACQSSSRRRCWNP